MRYARSEWKFLPRTWKLLQKARMSGKLLRNSDYPLTESGGLMIMSILADSCAGTTRSRVTDRNDAYATLSGFLGDNPLTTRTDKSGAYAKLVPLGLNILDAPRMSLKSLIALREREAKESGHARKKRHES
jgi:hypothetical protein